MKTESEFRQRRRACNFLLSLGLAAGALSAGTMAADLPAAGTQQASPQQVLGQAWMDRSLPPDRRASLVVQQMTLDEKIALVHGSYGYRPRHRPEMPQPPADAAGGDGYVPGIPRLGIPPLQLVGAGMGVTDLNGIRANGESTAFPAALATAASWSEELAYDVGRAIAREARDQGFNVHLGGGANVIREALGGRNFEYPSEDPLLTGKIVARQLRATQDQGVIATVKHYAANYQETDRHGMNVNMDERTLREVDLLPFEIAVRESGVGSVMCSYNKVNGTYACENDYLLNQVLKGDWGFKGWVMSDWGATHSTALAANAGLDQEFYRSVYFDKALKEAVQNGAVPTARLDDMVQRILRTMFAVGVIDNPAKVRPIDAQAGAAVAQRVAEQGSVLLRNNGLLPLSADRVKSIAVIGAHADVGVMSGGGSGRVRPVGGNAFVPDPEPTEGLARLMLVVWVPSSPLKAIQAKAPGATVTYDAGTDVAAAAKLAANSEVAVVFVNQHRTETQDLPNLSLPNGQDELVRKVAAANPRTIVVIQSGGAVLTPWANEVAGIFAAWYPGQRGAEALANLLFGDVNPSGKLPITFPKTEADLPRPVIPDFKPAAVDITAADLSRSWPLDVEYREGLAVGYRWFDAKQLEPRFAFGFGLSYTTFAASRLQVHAGAETVSVSFDLKNTGKRLGTEIPQVYLGFPEGAGEPPRRLAGWQRVTLRPGESRRVTIELDELSRSIWDVAAKQWRVPAGTYSVFVGTSSRDLPLRQDFKIAGR